jgi:hypothetical protein
MEAVTLKDGSTEFGPFVAALMLNLKSLAREAPIVLWEATKIARDREHAPFGNAGERLVAAGILNRTSDGRFEMHSSIRNVILNAVTLVTDSSIEICNPIAIEPT